MSNSKAAAVVRDSIAIVVDQKDLDRFEAEECKTIKEDLYRFAIDELMKGKPRDEVYGDLHKRLTGQVESALDHAIDSGDIDSRAVVSGAVMLLFKLFNYRPPGVDETVDLKAHYETLSTKISPQMFNALVDCIWVSRPGVMETIVQCEKPAQTQLDHYIQAFLIGSVIQARQRIGPSPVDAVPLSSSQIKELTATCLRPFVGSLVESSINGSKAKAEPKPKSKGPAKDTRELKGTRTHERKEAPKAATRRTTTGVESKATPGAGSGSGAAASSNSDTPITVEQNRNAFIVGLISGGAPSAAITQTTDLFEDSLNRVAVDAEQQQDLLIAHRRRGEALGRLLMADPDLITKMTASDDGDEGDEGEEGGSE